LRKLLSLLGAGALFLMASSSIHSASTSLVYPPARRGDQVDVYHGIAVADPYRWMEQIDSAETRAWIEAEDRLTQAYLGEIPGRDGIARRLTKLLNFERWSPPWRRGKNWFYWHNSGLQNQSVLFVTENPEQPGRALIDPNLLSRDGTVAVTSWAVSRDGTLAAYALSDGGSDWQVWHVREVATGKDLPDQLRWSKFGGATWRKDGRGFYYTAYAPPQPGEVLKAANQYQKLMFHRLGTPQSADVLVYTRADAPDWYIGPEVSYDGRYLILTVSRGTDVKNTLLVQDLSVENAPLIPIVEKPTASFEFCDNLGTTFYVVSDDQAPRYRLIAIDIAKPSRAGWRTLVPEGPDLLQGASLIGGQIIATYMHDAHSQVRRYSLDGKPLGSVELPGLGSVSGFAGHLDDAVTYFDFSSFTTPPSVYRYEVAGGTSTPWHRPTLSGYDPAQYETRQVFYTSKDGTRVPMFISARKECVLDGDNPTILTAYGGFNIPLVPFFGASWATWMELGGVVAVANLRGGGEYGREWHEAGMKLHKQRVFDDFIAAAEYLIAQHWTNPKRLAIWGGSNGGLLIGAVEEQRSDLFAAALPHVGVLDMLRFRDFTVGRAWEAEYGTVDNSEEFKAMLAYSPLQNVRAGVNYPATLVMTGDHDDRVFPAHSFKFAAAMQHADPTGKPILIRIETRAGHGMGKPLVKSIEETADAFAFILSAFGIAQ
jgi:prolyl oligopeptidase